MRLGVFQADIEAGFIAPTCPGCEKPLSAVVQELAPYVMVVTWEWDSENCRWRKSDQELIAAPDRKPVATFTCRSCGKRLTKRLREIFEAEVNQ